MRLRANYFWPAMWGSMFNVDDTANQPLADAFGIVMGSSHTGEFASLEVLRCGTDGADDRTDDARYKRVE